MFVGRFEEIEDVGVNEYFRVFGISQAKRKAL